MKMLILLLLITQTAKAENILLIANKDTPLTDYKKICEKNGYICLPQDYKSLAKTQSKYFDSLIENFDLDNKDYVSQFSKRLQQSLKEDDLSLDQIKNLILACEKLKITSEVKRLNKLYEVLFSLNDEVSDKIIYIAGKNVANNIKNRLLLEPYLQDIKHLEIDYVSIKENNDKKYFLNGDCEHPRYTEFLTQLDLQVIPHFPDGCNLSQRYNWGTDLMVDHFQEHRNKYLWGAAALATVFFMKSYELSISE